MDYPNRYLEKVTKTLQRKRKDKIIGEIQNIYKPHTFFCETHNHEYTQTPYDYTKEEGCEMCNNEEIESTFVNHKVFITRNINTNLCLTDTIRLLCNTCCYDFRYSLTGNAKRNKGTCPKCEQKVIKKRFLKRAKYIHGENSYNYEITNSIVIDTNTCITLKCKNCERGFRMKTKNHLRGMGCPNCKLSKGPKMVSEILDTAGISYDTRFFEFHLDMLPIYIETKGKQHYNTLNFFGGIESFIKRVQFDVLKINFVRERGGILIFVTEDRENFLKKYGGYLQDLYSEKTIRELPVKGYKSVIKHLQKILKCFRDFENPHAEIVELESNIKKLLQSLLGKSRPSERLWKKIRKLDENQLEKLLNAFPDNPWDYKSLSKNPNLVWDFVSRNLDKSWDWFELSKNPAISWDTVQSTRYHESTKWSPKYLEKNPNNPSFTIYREQIAKKAKKATAWESLQKNPSVKIDWYSMSKNPNITWDIIEANPNYSWDWEVLAKNPNITLDLVIQNYESFVNIAELQEIQFWISKNPNLEWDDIQKYSGIRDNPQNIAYTQLSWDWEDLSAHPNLYWEVIKYAMDASWILWDFFWISKNPNITYDIIRKNPNERWCWDNISSNKFNKHPAVRRRNALKKLQYYKSILRICMADLLPLEIIFHIAHFVSQKFITD